MPYSQEDGSIRLGRKTTYYLSDTNAFAVYCKAMFEKGVYLAPSQFEAMFLSLAHTENEINDILNAIEATIN